MKALLAWIAPSLPLVFPGGADRPSARHRLGVDTCRPGVSWDEVLMAAMQDANARSFLELLGPRDR